MEIGYFAIYRLKVRMVLLLNVEGVLVGVMGGGVHNKDQSVFRVHVAHGQLERCEGGFLVQQQCVGAVLSPAHNAERVFQRSFGSVGILDFFVL